jgi:hypothetical protein
VTIGSAARGLGNKSLHAGALQAARKIARFLGHSPQCSSLTEDAQKSFARCAESGEIQFRDLELRIWSFLRISNLAIRILDAAAGSAANVSGTEQGRPMGYT